MTLAFTAVPVPPSLLGESPFWHPDEGALYWCDIPGRQINRWQPEAGWASGEHQQWSFDTEPACCAPMPDGRLLVAFRDGLFGFDPRTGQRECLSEPPYDRRQERFNDGKCDPQGRLWVGTLYEPRTPPNAALYRFGGGKLQRMVGDATVCNGLAFSPDGRTMYWSDTTSHRVYAFDFDGSDGSLSQQRVFAQFEPKMAGQDLVSYGGRPDGAAVDAEGAYWCALFEGQRLVRFAPDGRVLQSVPLPVRCPTMPCFGGPDLRTLFVTTSREKRPAAELATQPWAGKVLMARVDVPGLPVNFARA